jgi:hypothetical protein
MIATLEFLALIQIKEVSAARSAKNHMHFSIPDAQTLHREQQYRQSAMDPPLDTRSRSTVGMRQQRM